ncbi:MAG: CBS domain-containing protein [Desulfocucumaceae bacterium]
MSKEKIIGDVMVSLQDYSAIPANAGFREVVSTLKKSVVDKGVDTLLVYDNNLLIGFISIEEVLSAIEPQFLKGGTYRGWTVNKEWAIPVFWDGLFTDRCIESTGKKAREIMKAVELEVETTDPLIKAVFGMSKHSAKLLPVTSDSLVVGIIRGEELFMEINALVGTAETPVYILEKVKTPKATAAAK